MTLLHDITSHIILSEGFQRTAYICPAGYLTIGYGRNVQTKGITEPEAYGLLENDLMECFDDLETQVFKCEWPEFPDNIKFVFVDMRYNLGAAGFRKFRKMIEAGRRTDWKGVRQEMISSAWHDQIGYRAIRLIEKVDELIT